MSTIKPGIEFTLTSEGRTVSARHGKISQSYKVIAKREDSDKWICHLTSDNTVMMLSDNIYKEVEEDKILAAIPDTHLHEDIDMAILEAGFKVDLDNNLKWNANDGYWDYHVYFEGYAYVLYMNYRSQEVPILEFQDAEPFRTLYKIMTTYIDKGDLSF